MSIKILHIGYGFRPWRGGGLIEYAEDLMTEQTKKGYIVSYFCSGRHYPFYKKTFLRKWNKKGYKIYEVVNPPIYHGGDRGTFFDLKSPPIENIFIKVLNEFRPDLIHIQELAGLSSSLIDISKSYNFPVIMTLHDYFLLCPTLKLFDYKYNDCFEEYIGRKCIFCLKSNIKENQKHLIMQTLNYELKKFLYLKNVLKKIYRIVKKTKFFSSFQNTSEIEIKNPEKYSVFFQERRHINIQRLKKIDLLIAQSKKVEEIYRYFLQTNNIKIKTIHSTIAHVEKIRPKKINPKIPIRFGTLNGFASIPKGAKILLETIKILKEKGLANKFELYVFGGILPDMKEKIKDHNNVFYHGTYDVNELNSILETVDVGIVPSIWQECYGYVGIEFLAKGIPVIGNNKGGIVDYLIEGFTGWVNKISTSEELSEIMEEIINKPFEIFEMNRKIIERRNEIIKTMSQHFHEIDSLYRELLIGRNKSYIEKE